LFIVGIISHRAFCVRTTVDKWVFPKVWYKSLRAHDESNRRWDLYHNDWLITEINTHDGMRGVGDASVYAE
jgi:LEA14-like dessication related protein